MGTGNDGLAAIPAQLNLLWLPFAVGNAGLVFAGADVCPVALGHLVDDLKPPVAAAGYGP